MRRTIGGGWAPPWRWGVFLRRPCERLLLEGLPDHLAPMGRIYEALKRRGFRETYWQFVYHGQIGGLVKTPKGQLYELHVRFFDSGMLYAELEIGRSLLLHFVVGRKYLNTYIASILRAALSDEDLLFLLKATQQYKDQSPNEWSEWSAHNLLLTRSARRAARLLYIFSDWRVLAFAMALAAGAAIGPNTVVIPALAALLILLYLIAPTRPR